MGKNTIRIHRPPNPPGIIRSFCLGVLFGFMATGLVVSLTLFKPGPAMEEWCTEVDFGKSNP